MIDPDPPLVEPRAIVLIVDDEPLNIEIAAAALESDYEIVFATSGHAALEQAAAIKPDLILLDVMMPDIDGYEVCRRLKTDTVTQDIPVIFLTARSEESEEAKGLDLGAVDYITKPIRSPIVKARVRNHVALKQYRDALARMAKVDGLTGVWNRRAFDEYLDQEWKRAQRSGESLSLILIDVDHFKKFNDGYGHAAGDDCLRRVAQALKGQIKRPADIVARYGGEEFVCVLPETGAEGAVLLAERMRDAVGALGIPHAHSPTATIVSISGGVATTRPSSRTAARDLIERADALLYQAKQAGRNRIETGALTPA
jgi:diguanylate cyclase (GGDEF)-like protein